MSTSEPTAVHPLFMAALRVLPREPRALVTHAGATLTDVRENGTPVDGTAK